MVLQSTLVAILYSSFSGKRVGYMLVAESIIELVQFADWATSIVPVLKQDKVPVRICGDFKLTINQVFKLDRYPIPRI